MYLQAVCAMSCCLVWQQSRLMCVLAMSIASMSLSCQVLNPTSVWVLLWIVSAGVTALTKKFSVYNIIAIPGIKTCHGTNVTSSQSKLMCLQKVVWAENKANNHTVLSSCMHLKPCHVFCVQTYTMR